MAKTTAVIDGDSSGLVGALDKGKAGMEKMEAEGKKLSDQLREVTDSVDKAAGALVQKIGGPTAIKAIAGVGGAMGIAKAGVDAFLGSAESLFKSFGEAGTKVWDETEKSLFAIKGAFAEAVLGGGSVEEMGYRLQTMFRAVKSAVDFALTPIKLVSQALWGTDKAARAAKFGLDDYNAAVATAKKTSDDMAKSVEDVHKQVVALTGSIQDGTRATYADVRAKVQGAIDEANASAYVQNAKIAATVLLSNIDRITKEAHDATELLVFRGFLDRTKAAEHEATLIRENSELLVEQVRSRNLAMTGERKASMDKLQADLERLNKAEAEALKELDKPKVDRTGGGPSGPDPVEDAKQKARDIRWHFKWMAIGIAEDTAKAEVDAAKRASDNIDSVIAKARERVGAATDAGKQASDKVAEAEKAAREANYNQFVNQNAKMLAISIANGEKMADVARAAIGNIVSALGDKAMSEAALLFATGNVAGAAALTAAGAAAYATAAFLGATDKKSGSSTKATTAKEAPTVTNNTAFNLQIDAAFADEESIARSFAKAQALARARHMTPYAMT